MRAAGRLRGVVARGARCGAACRWGRTGENPLTAVVVGNGGPVGRRGRGEPAVPTTMRELSSGAVAVKT